MFASFYDVSAKCPRVWGTFVSNPAPPDRPPGFNFSIGSAIPVYCAGMCLEG